MPSIKKIACLIIDDEPPAQVILKKYISQVSSLELIGVCNNAVEAISLVQRQHVDLLFLDIQMPGLLGTTFIRTLNNPPKVIFTTAYRKFAVEGFELNAVDYLLKPVSFDRFLKGINKVLQLDLHSSNEMMPHDELGGDKNHPFLYLRVNRKMVKILFEEIQFIESLKDYIKIFTETKTIISRHSISAMEEMLPKINFSVFTGLI